MVYSCNEFVTLIHIIIFIEHVNISYFIVKNVMYNCQTKTEAIFIFGKGLEYMNLQQCKVANKQVFSLIFIQYTLQIKR